MHQYQYHITIIIANHHTFYWNDIHKVIPTFQTVNAVYRTRKWMKSCLFAIYSIVNVCCLCRDFLSCNKLNDCNRLHELNARNVRSDFLNGGEYINLTMTFPKHAVTIFGFHLLFLNICTNSRFSSAQFHLDGNFNNKIHQIHTNYSNSN